MWSYAVLEDGKKNLRQFSVEQSTPCGSDPMSSPGTSISKARRRTAVAGRSGASSRGSVDTLVILMGRHNLREIMKRLVEDGCEPQRSAALIQSGTTVEQSTVTGTGETIPELVNRYRFGTPTVVVVGRAVDLGWELQWFSETMFEFKRARSQLPENSPELGV
jgi:hypothetical protein